MEAFKVIWKQLLKDTDKAPGWIPLLALVLLVLELAGPPAHVRVLGKQVPFSTDVIAGLITLLLYQLGDAIDERIFKERKDDKVSTKARYRRGYTDASSKAQDALGVDERGLYALAGKLARAAEKERDAVFVYLPNEVAKFFRSLIVPLGVLGVVGLLKGDIALGITSLISSGVALGWYPWLKVEHIRRLYSSAALIAAQEQYAHRDADGVRLFFWGGKFVDAVIRSSNR